MPQNKFIAKDNILFLVAYFWAPTEIISNFQKSVWISGFWLKGYLF